MLAKILEKYNNRKYEKAYVIIPEGEEECAKCKGTGHDLSSPFWRKYDCKRCCGLGCVDWVTNVMGRKDEDYEESCYSSSVSSTSPSTFTLRRVK